ncbi:nuclease-related domain-containing protein [Sandarakinorhabdus rubra]|uniref:nuclease-related domain-containing protein n=1 Tax=Sandarakinorhabdus rubra TaxID=2672568 RepID=UPI0013D97B5E|nr:nuclease-related domain-containing protein [Sandarakinorhabdus rubra]
MILKPREDRNASIAALERLMAHPAATRHDIQRLRDQIDAIIKGDLSEGKAAFELDTHYGHNRNWMVIHDLRIEVAGMTAQIDHLLLGRCLDFWVLESKRLASGIKVLENGECLTFRNGRIPVAIDSPIEQNRRHVKMLQRLLDSGAIALPRRLGFALKPRLHNLVLIAEGRISRPKTAVPGIESLIRTDLMFSHVESMSERGNPFDLAKVVSPDTLEDIGRQLVAQHQPIEYDWERRFLDVRLRQPAQQVSEPAVRFQPPPRAANVVELRSAPAKAGPAAPPSAPQKKARAPVGTCEACPAPVSSGVKTFCEKNAERFGNRILCMKCQSGAVASA